jgi:hypothetical protein
VRIHAGVPQELVDGWEQSPQTPSANTAVDFHYHDVEEWLTVVRGEITFFTLADEPFPVEVGRVLRIPRGEVHRVEVGADGVEYRMFLPIAVSAFVNELTPTELEAFRRNLEFPDYEDGRVEGGREFFENNLSTELVFCRADGSVVDREKFIKNAFVDKGRSSAGSVRVLNKTASGLLISTVVHMTDAGSVRSFTNVRFLAAEDGTFRCRVWANYPQLAPD